MASWSKVAVDEGVSREEPLSLPRRFEALHLPFAAPGRAMRILGAIVQVVALPVLDIRQKLALGHAVALQLVGDENARYVLQLLQETLEEALRCPGAAAGLYQNVKHGAVLIDGAPEIMLFPVDPNEDFVQVPFVTGPVGADEDCSRSSRQTSDTTDGYSHKKQRCRAPPGAARHLESSG
jgi:hypothetical protein